MIWKSLLICASGYLCLLYSSAPSQTWLPQYPGVNYNYIYNRNEPAIEDIFSDTGLTLLSRWPWGPCWAADVNEDYAYIGNGSIVQILDISNPASPQIVGEFVTEHYIPDLAFRNGLLFVSGVINNLESLIILDVSEPASPELLGMLPIPGGVLRLEAVDSFVYVNTAGFTTFRVVDVSNPHQPFLRGSVPIGAASGIALAAKGSIAYSGTFAIFSDFLIIDATDPDNLQTYPFPSWMPVEAHVHEDLLFVGSIGVLEIYDVANPLAPQRLSEFSTSANPRAIIANDFIVYIADYLPSSIKAIDVSNPAQPYLRGSYNTPLPTIIAGSGIGSSSAIANGYLYTTATSGLLILNIENPDSLEFTGFFPTSEATQDAVVQDDLAYIIAGNAGLWILDISEVSNPRSLGNLNLGSYPQDIVVDRNLAFVLANDVNNPQDSLRGLWIIEVSDPATPSVLVHYTGILNYDLAYTPNQIAQWGNLIMITQSPAGGNSPVLEVVDVTNPSQPIRAGLFYSSFNPRDIAVKDTVVYLATSSSSGNGQLKLLSIANPSQPVEISTILQTCYAVAVRDSIAYVAGGDTFYTVNVAHPHAPFVSGAIYSDVFGHDIAVAGNFAYWVGRNQLEVFDITNPNTPRSVARYGKIGFPIYGVEVKADTIVLANVFLGATILRNDIVSGIREHEFLIFPKDFTLSQNFPNPFNAETAIEFYAPKSAEVFVEVFNLLGEKVQILFRGRVNPGRHRIAFDASRLASGIYFYRLASRDISITKKMVLMR